MASKSPEAVRSQGRKIDQGSARKTSKRANGGNSTRYNDSKAAVTGGTRPDTVAAVFKGIDDSPEKPAVKQKLKNKAMQSMAGYGETYLQGFRENRPGASRRVYIYKDSIPGTKVLDTAAAKIDKYTQEGNTEKVEKILEALRTGAPRINKALDDQYGPKRLDSQATEAADVANRVREEILKEIEAI